MIWKEVVARGENVMVREAEAHAAIREAASGPQVIKFGRGADAIHGVALRLVDENHRKPAPESSIEQCLLQVMVIDGPDEFIPVPVLVDLHLRGEFEVGFKTPTRPPRHR